MTTELSDERLMTVTDVAEWLQVHPNTVRRHIKAGKLRSVHVGRNVRILKGDLESYLQPESEDHARIETQQLLSEARRLLDQLRIELPQHRSPARRVAGAQNGNGQERPGLAIGQASGHSSNGHNAQTNGNGYDVAAAKELVVQHRRAIEEYDRASGGTGRRF